MKSFQAMTFPTIFWQKSNYLIPYPQSTAWMKAYVKQIYAGKAPECLWFLEHPRLYTAGTSAKEEDLLNSENIPIYRSNRGGQWTYHGPGQRILYVMMDLRKNHPHIPARDIHAFVYALEEWVAKSLEKLGIQTEKRSDRIGLWVIDPKTGKEEKIAALGIKLSHWISWHGIALNVQPNLGDYQGIIPCGLQSYGVTSLQKLGVNISMDEIDRILIQEWENFFGNPLQPMPRNPDFTNLDM